MRKLVLTLLLGIFFVNFTQAQFEIPKKPSKQTSLYDDIGLLSKSQARDLERKLIRYSDSTSTQIVITIIESTKGENINYLAANWGEKWGIGQAGKDNGILVLLAKGDRDIAISTGKGVESRLTDLMSKRIIETRIISEFKRGDYYRGLDRGTDGIFEVLQGEFKENRKRNRKGLLGIIPLVIIIILLIIFRGRGGGRGGRRSVAGTILDVIILSNMGRGSFGGGSSSGGFGGGGFSGGFGGGSFGGGGASGSW